MQVRKIGVPLAFSVLLNCTLLSSAKADQIITTERTTTTTTNPTTIAPTTAPSSVVYFGAASPAILVTTIEGRRKDLEAKVNEAQRSGAISAAQAETIKVELKRIAKETGTNTISYPMAVMLASDLDLIGQQYANKVVYVPIITGSTYTVCTGKTYTLDDFSARRAGLETRITKDLFQGRLTASRAADLRMQLASIGNEANLYNSTGTFNAKESRHLYDAFDHVASEIDKSAGKDKAEE